LHRGFFIGTNSAWKEFVGSASRRVVCTHLVGSLEFGPDRIKKSHTPLDKFFEPTKHISRPPPGVPVRSRDEGPVASS
jgi:hypothetical protein